MTSRRTKLKKLTGSIRMRSRDKLIHLRDTRLRSMGVYNYPSLILIPVMLALIVLLGSFKQPAVVRRSYRPTDLEVSSPMSGWAVHADTYGQDDRLDVSLVYAELTWAELEAEKGVYDFESFEEKNHLNEWWAEGKRVILRFVTDRPGEEQHKDIPEWLVKEMGGEVLAGSFYSAQEGCGFSPDYSNLAMRDAHGKVIAALAQRYDEHHGVAYIEIGSLGYDGVWTVDLSEEDVHALPTSSVSREYTWHYTVNFKNTLMLMRRPYKEAELMEVGLYTTDLGSEEAMWEYIDSIEEGGYDHQIETDLVAMPDFYLISPSGAHISADVDPERLLKADKYSLSRQIMESHLTYAVIDQPTTSLSDEAIETLGEIENVIGWRIWIRSAQWDTRRRASMTSKVTLKIRNDGITPPHGSWRIALALFEEGEDAKQMVYSQFTDLNGELIRSGETELTAWLEIPYGIEPGSYTLAAALIDSQDGQTAVPMFMKEYDASIGWTMLGEIEIAR